MSEWVIEGSQRDFDRDVIARSRDLPVVVDFWAPWCGPCRTLGPILERLAREHAGSFVLVKINVDENPQLAGSFGARSIPMVLAFRDGQVADSFVGALPEAEVRGFLRRILPSEAELAAGEGEGHLARNDAAEAERCFRRALELDPRCAAALLGLARLLFDRRDDDAALELAERVAPGSPQRAEAERLAAAIRIRKSGGADPAELRARVNAAPEDLDARFALAGAIAAGGHYEEALREYLEIIRRNRSYQDGAARRAMLDIFDVLGASNDLVERYRSELARILFS